MKTVLTGKNILPLVILLGLAVMLSGCVQSSRRTAGRPGPAIVLQKYDASGLLQFEPRQEISLLSQAKQMPDRRLDGKLRRAADQLRRTREQHGEESVQYAEKANNYAVLLMQRGNVMDYDRVDKLLSAAISVWLGKVGFEHPATATSFYNKGWLYSWQDDENFNTSENLFKAAYQIRLEKLGRQPATAVAARTLGDWCLATGRHDKAEHWLDTAAKMWWEDIWHVEYTKDDIVTNILNIPERRKIITHLTRQMIKVYTHLNRPDDVKHGRQFLALIEQQTGSGSGAYRPQSGSRRDNSPARAAQLDPAVARDLARAAKLNNRVETLYKQGKYQEAIRLARESLAIREKALGPDHPGTANSLNNLATLYKSLGAYSKAEPLYKRALAIHEKALGADHPNTATSLNNLAALYDSLGAYSKAEPLYKRALAIDEKALGPDHPGTATDLNNLALLYKSLGAYSKAEPLYKRALAIDEKALGPDHPDTATDLNNLALLYKSLGAYSKAEPLYKRAMANVEKALGPDHPHTATSLNNLAGLYYSLGAYSKAEPLYKRALAIREKALGPDHPDTAQSLNNLAELYRSLGAYSKAEPLYKRALAIHEKALGPDHPRTAVSLDNLAFLHLAQGKVDQALAHFRKTGNRANLGCCFLAERRFDRAKEKFSAYLAYGRNRPGYEEDTIGTLIGLGRAEQGLGNLEAARTSFREAVDLIEGQYKTLSPEARRTFLGGNTKLIFKRIHAYEGLILALVKEQGPDYAKKSLQVAEQVKSRLLLEQLAARDAGATTGRDAEMLKKDRQFQLKISMLYKELAVLDKLIREGKQVDRGRRKEVSRDLARQQKEYEQFINQVKLNNRELASLISVQTVDIAEIQGLLDPETTIVEYFIGSRGSYAWTITRNRVTVQPLDLTSKKAAALVNDYRGALLPGQVRRGLLDRGVAGVVPLFGMETSPYTKYRNATDDECRHITSRIGAQLYAKLLAPVAGQLQTRELIIVPHGPLHKLPFAALETEGSYLMEKYTLSTAPSSSALGYITKKRNPNQGRLLAFANPKTMYPPLPGTETEVAHIRPLFAGGATVYKRAAATETRARLAAGSPDVLHFASHGEFNERQPMQSGLLLTGDNRNDGKLQVHELFGLDLKNANLVTLSACSTALARIESGDDMVGLSRGFIYAGTPALLASLWEVEDAATATLMEEFYRNWLQKKMPRPLALQTAQRTLRNNPRTSAPYYWAAFELIGDWM